MQQFEFLCQARQLCIHLRRLQRHLSFHGVRKRFRQQGQQLHKRRSRVWQGLLLKQQVEGHKMVFEPRVQLMP